MRSEPFEPNVEILMEAGFVIIDKNRGGYVHCVHERQSLFNTALLKAILNLGSNIDKCPACRDIEPQLFAKALHDRPPEGCFGMYLYSAFSSAMTASESIFAGCPVFLESAFRSENSGEILMTAPSIRAIFILTSPNPVLIFLISLLSTRRPAL